MTLGGGRGGSGVDDDWSVRAILTTMLPLLLGLTVVVMGAGYVLEELAETYLDNPTLFVLIPVMIAMGGNLGTIMSSRISTRLHLGGFSFHPTNPVLVTNVAAVFALSVTVFGVLGVVAYGIGQVIQRGLPLVDLLVISLVSGVLLTVVAIVTSVTATYLSFKLGLNPDDTVIPIVTSVCDVFGAVILTVVAIAVL